ncbi:uncharacterized protein LOC144704381 [Wolffia australiana]
MAKKGKKKKTGVGSAMDISAEAPSSSAQLMDTSEGKVISPSLGTASRKIRKGVPMRRAKNLRKVKAMERAISNDEKLMERLSKEKDKVSRIVSAKSLYD